MVPAEKQTDIAAVFRAAIGLAALTAAAAILTARDLVYDGAYYLLGIAAHGRFQFFEPARRMSQFLQQVFAVAGARLGIHDLWTLGMLFSLGCSGWPVILTALCWFVLPRRQKVWIAGPLLNLAFAIPATNFIGIGEGIIASCLLWLAFFLIEFRSGRALGALACIVATGACCFSHEAAMLCLLVIAIAAARRMPNANRFCRVALFVTAAFALAGSANMARLILMPRSAVERGDFLVSMLGGFLGTLSAPNIPVLMSLIAAGCCLAAIVSGGNRVRWAAIVTLAAAIIFPVLLVAFPDRLIAPSRYFAARGLPVALTTLTAGWFLLLRWRKLSPARFETPPVIAILTSLVFAQAAMQAAITAEWLGYLRDLRTFVASESGTISYGQAMARLDPDGARFRRELLAHWSVEPLSILLAPEGHVRAFVAASPEERWVPYDPADPARLPHAPGLDWSAFVVRPSP